MPAIDSALRAAGADSNRPSLIACRTLIGYGSPNKQDTHEAHGSPLGPEEVQLTKLALGMPADRTFWIPEEVEIRWRSALALGRRWKAEWEELIARYSLAHPEPAAAFRRALEGKLPDGWDAALPSWNPGEALAPRTASAQVLETIAPGIPTLVGGSADLSASNGTRPSSAVDVRRGDFRGRYIRYGIREHAMAGIMTGMALHGGVIPYGGTYLAFSDYMRPAVRVAAMMGAPVIYVWTHDSVSVGEDGPTHQRVEQIASLRCVPDLVVFRPADANETVGAWRYALTHRERPVALVHARQVLPVLPSTTEAGATAVTRGAYVVADAAGGPPDVIVIATGSEVSVAIAARDLLTGRGVRTRVVSMPRWELFREQDAAYREHVLPAAIAARVSVEAGGTHGWECYAGPAGATIGIDRYGESGKGPDVMRYLGITPEHIVTEALRVLGVASRDAR